MEYIINQILKVLDENNISVYSFARTTKINQSTLHKILHFERTMKPKHFYTIMDNLPISYNVKKDLYDKYNKIILGDERYNAQQYIYEMLKKFSDISFSFLNELLAPPVNVFNAENTATIYKGSTINTTINICLIEEMSKQNPKAYVYVPGGNHALDLYVDSVIKLYETDINIVLMIDFINNTNEQNTNYNLSILRNIIPIALTSTKNYNFYYTYVDAITNESYMTPYPYFIALSDRVIWINAAFDEIMVINDINIAKNIATVCQGKLTKYKKLLEINSDVNSIVNSLVSNQGDITTHYCIEYEPCLSMYFTMDMVDAIMPKDAPNRELIYKVLYQRYLQLQKIKDSIQIFNKNSLMEFAETGIIKEFPKEYSRPCTKDERLYILNALMNTINSDKHIIRALNPVNFQISDCLSLIVQDDACIQFSIWNDNKIPLKYLAITETSLCRYFYDFISGIVDTPMIYSKEETIKFIQEAIDYLK